MVRRSARLIKQGGEPQAKDADTNRIETIKPTQALDEASPATSTNAGDQKQDLGESGDNDSSAAVTKESKTFSLNLDHPKPDSPKPQRQKRKYVRQKRLSTASDEPVAPANGPSNKDFTAPAKPLKLLQNHKTPVPKKVIKEPAVKPRIGKMTTTIHKTADQRKIIRVFKRKSLFPEVKKFKENKIFKKPRYTDLTMEEQYMQDDSIDERNYEAIIKDIESLTNVQKDECLMECMKTLRRLVVPCESEYHDLHSGDDYGLSTSENNLELSQAIDGVEKRANDIAIQESSPELKIFEEEQDQVLYDLLSKDDDELSEENIVATIASLNNIDISHINTLLINRSVPRASKLATRETYTNDEIRKDHDSLSQKMNVKRRKK